MLLKELRNKIKEAKTIENLQTLVDCEKFLQSKLNDVAFMNMLCEYNGLILKFAGDEVKDNDQVVITAVRDNPKAVQFASDRMKKNPEIVSSLIYNGYDYLIDKESAFKDRDVVFNLVKLMPLIFKDLSTEMKDDEEIVYEDFLYDYRNFEFASDRQVIEIFVQNW